MTGGTRPRAEQEVCASGSAALRFYLQEQEAAPPRLGPRPPALAPLPGEGSVVLEAEGEAAAAKTGCDGARDRVDKTTHTRGHRTPIPRLRRPQPH